MFDKTKLVVSQNARIFKEDALTVLGMLAAGADPFPLRNVKEERALVDTMCGYFDELKANPDNLEIRFELARSFDKLGDSSHAEAEYAEAVKRSPTTVAQFVEIAEAADRFKNNDLALEGWKGASTLAPENVRYATNYANRCFSAQQFYEATKAYEKALELKPDDVILKGALAIITKRIGVREKLEAGK